MRLSSSAALPALVFLLSTESSDAAAQGSHPAPATSRKSVAMLPFRSSRQVFDIAGYRATPSEVNRFLMQRAQNRLVLSGRHQVLERDYLVTIMGEQDLIRSADTHPGEQIKVGKRLGADYIITGSIEDLTVVTTSRTIELTGTVTKSTTARVHIDFRVLNVVTSAVEIADSLRISLGDLEIQGLSQSHPNTRLDDAVLDLAASKMIHVVQDGIFPIKVAKVDAGRVYLNEGAARIRENDQFVVYKPGDAVIDPDTGAVLGSADTQVAVVRAATVTSKFTIATVVSGQLDESSRGFLCRAKQP